jgi:hypothetical protein
VAIDLSGAGASQVKCNGHHCGICIVDLANTAWLSEYSAECATHQIA